MDATRYRALRASREIRRRRERRLIDYVRWLPLQREFLGDPAKRKQMRAGNQTLGKSWAGFAEGIYHSLGRHPFYEVPPPPSEGLVVFPSWSSYVKDSGKLWDLVPKDEVHPDTTWTPGLGFGGRYPHIRWRNGSMTWIATGSQDVLALAGPTYDWIHLNEPPKNGRVFTELTKRTVRGNPGRVWLTYTPVNAPVDYLRTLCEDGKIVDHWMPLSVEAMIPVGSDRPVRLPNGQICDSVWVQEQIDGTLPHEVPVVVHGEWEFRIDGNVFRAFRKEGQGAHVTEELPVGDVELQIGLDHGSGANFSAAAVLVAVKPHPRHPKVWVLDEYVSSGETTEEQDAQAILAMLERWNKSWRDLKRAYGDRPWQRGTLQRKSNDQLSRALEHEMTQRAGTLHPEIRTVKRGKGRGGWKSVHMGCAFLHRAMVRDGHFHVHPRCEQVIASFGRWDGRDDDWKHILDALRYSLDSQIFSGLSNVRQPKVYVY